MITPEYLEQCPDRLVEIYEQAERDIIADMARKISKYDYFSSAAEWQAMKLQEMGLTYKEIQKRLAKASGKTKAEIVRLLKEAGVKELKDDGVKPTQSTVNTLNAGLSKTLGTFDNLTRTTATQGTRQISQALDRAYAQVSSGAFSQETAVKNAISDLAKNGIEAYDYGTRKDYIDVVVRRAVRTGVNQTVAKIALSNADELGTDLVEVSAHSGARPSHAEWQGKVYSISGNTEGYEKLSEATGYGSVTGLCGTNCRHTFYPFFEGDEPTYSKEELKSFDKPKYTYNGEKMTEYEATQRQRYIERQIRRWKREKVGMEAAGLSSERANAKLKKWGEIQADFLGQTGLKRQYGREEIPKTPKIVEKPVQNAIIKKKRKQLEDYKDEPTAIKMLMDETGLTEKEAKNVKSALNEYFGNDYKDFTAGKKQKEVKLIDDTLAKMDSYDGEIYRGMHLVPRELDALLENAEVGKKIKMKSISSWSSSESVANRFSQMDDQNDSVIFVCKNNESGVGVRHLSKVGAGEDEVLAPSSTSWRIVNITKEEKTKKNKMTGEIYTLKSYDNRTDGFVPVHKVIIEVEEVR